MSNFANVTMPYAEFAEIQKARAAAEQRAAELEEQLKKNEIAASDQTLLAIAHAGIEIARYAVGSLPAESNKGWPGKALRTIAASLPSLPGTSIDDQSLAITFTTFADEIDLYERRRQGLASTR